MPFTSCLEEALRNQSFLLFVPRSRYEAVGLRRRPPPPQFYPPPLV